MQVRVISILIVFLTSCHCRFIERDKKIIEKKDIFYSDLGGMGRPRIPLIKPYQLLKVSVNDWRLELQNPELLALSIHNVKGVNIQDSLILIYSEGGTDFLNEQHQKAWFIIKPSLGLENGFSDEKKFKYAIGHQDAVTTLHFHSPDSVYDSFEKHGKIGW